MKSITLALIRLYQKLAPARITSGSCRFTPPCSQYMYEAVERYGIVKGIILGARRIARCHPWSEGGFDPIPNP